MSRVLSSVALMGMGRWWWSGSAETPVVRVNFDDSLLLHWPSERFGVGADEQPECSYWNFSVHYDGSMCSHFVIGRAAASPITASWRAFRCAAVHESRCILSPEVGFAVPSAFIYDHALGNMITITAPQMLPIDTKNVRVRVSPPDGDGILNTRTFIFNQTVRITYVDEGRAVHTTVLHDEDAFCVQLLRAAYEQSCWDKLD